MTHSPESLQIFFSRHPRVCYADEASGALTGIAGVLRLLPCRRWARCSPL